MTPRSGSGRRRASSGSLAPIERRTGGSRRGIRQYNGIGAAPAGAGPPRRGLSLGSGRGHPLSGTSERWMAPYAANFTSSSPADRPRRPTALRLRLFPLALVVAPPGRHLMVLGGGWILMRSEERRVGKECRSRWSPYH